VLTPDTVLLAGVYDVEITIPLELIVGVARNVVAFLKVDVELAVNVPPLIRVLADATNKP
jgi:hypothetical protein